jgi:amino acid transporter
MSENVLSRRLNLLHATAINMIDMVGIGPFITLPLVIKLINGPYFLWAWIAGAFLSFMDSMVWAELGSAFPKAGGSYNFLKETYGPTKLGKLMSFLFVWQTMIQAPLVIASAAIGFSSYFGYLVSLTHLESKLLSGAVVILIVVLLYRRIESIGRLSVLLWIGVLITLGSIIFIGLSHGNFSLPVKQINEGLHLDFLFAVALGAASVKTMYSYLGYYNVCHLGSEIINPKKNIPKSMFLSIFGIAVIYISMNISVSSVIPWNIAKDSEYVVSLFFEKTLGKTAAVIATIMILWVAFSSVFSATLGYSRIPFAAARDGAFFKIFGKVHPTKQFPYISLLALGAVAFIFSLLFKLSEVISAILAMRILVQFIGQAVGLLLIRRKRASDFSYRMPLYPLPVIIAILMWIAVLASTGAWLISIALGFMTLGTVTFLIKSFYKKEWPFKFSTVFDQKKDDTF